MDGIAIIDKEEGWTSHDVVAKFRGIAKTKRVGHLGTLDPMATGVLPLAVGIATRLVKFYAKAEKIYHAGVCFGFATNTYDRTGSPLGDPQLVTVTDAQLEKGLERFRGRISQMPPQFSAKKVSGVVAYKAARSGIEVKLEPAEIEIRELEVLAFDGRRVNLRVRCSAGTYIRSLAHDLGVLLGCGAHLDSLRRLASGEFTIDRARPLGETVLIPLADLLPEFPVFVADEVTADSIRHGRDFSAQGQEANYLRAVSQTGELIAICDRAADFRYHPSVVVG